TFVEVARPDNDRPSHGLVLIPDINRLHPLFDDLVTKLASENNWAVAAVEPFADKKTMTIKQQMNAIPSLNDDRQLADILTTADLLDVEPIGVIRFCIGGMYTMKAASTNRFDRAGAFYKMIRVPDTWRGPTQRDTVD